MKPETETQTECPPTSQVRSERAVPTEEQLDETRPGPPKRVSFKALKGGPLMPFKWLDYRIL